MADPQLSTLLRGFGRHSPELPNALTLVELGALLGRAAQQVPCDLFVEVPPARVKGRRGKKIDFVWALPAKELHKERRWVPIAGFEVEGLGANHDSLREDVGKLNTLANGDDIPLAVILYRTSETGNLFWRRKKATLEEQMENLLRDARDVLAKAAGSASAIPAYLDESLLAKWRNEDPVLPGWIEACRVRARELHEAEIVEWTTSRA